MSVEDDFNELDWGSEKYRQFAYGDVITDEEFDVNDLELATHSG